MCGMDYRIPDEIVADPTKFKDFIETYMPDKTSRSGDGLAAGSGNGTSSSPSAIDSSAANLSN